MIKHTRVRRVIIFLLWFNLSIHASESFDWAVIGAGAAGVIGVGALLDRIPPDRIIWFDPAFNVGRMGKFYNRVPANSRAQEMAALMKAFESFKSCSSMAISALLAYPIYAEFYLQSLVEPLADITQQFIRRGIHAVKGMADELVFHGDHWQIYSGTQSYRATRVILAIGAQPELLSYPGPSMIPLDYAVDKETLRTYIGNNDTIAVVGSGSSAILLLKHLSELPVKKVINFLKHHHTIARQKSLIRGATADWLKNVLEKSPPQNLLRVPNTPENRDLYLPECNKIIYAIGYERNPLPHIVGMHEPPWPNKTGVLGPHLFGLGFAYPEELTYPSANGQVVVPLVGVTSFMNFAKRMIPRWQEL